jgi:hypothetical protein
LKIGSVFSGIGGIELAFQRQGFQTAWFVEKDAFCRKILQKNFPGVLTFDDVKSFNAMLLQAGFRATTFQTPDRDLALLANKAAFGRSNFRPFACFDQSSHSWRTFQRSLSGDLVPSSAIWPRSGMTRNGIAYELPSLGRRISANESSLLPTPSASDYRDRGSIRNPSILRRMRIGKQLMLSMLFDGRPCPSCVEGMMGFPKDWTRLG